MCIAVCTALRPAPMVSMVPHLHFDRALVQSRLAADTNEEVVGERPHEAHRPGVIEIATVLQVWAEWSSVPLPS